MQAAPTTRSRSAEEVVAAQQKASKKSLVFFIMGSNAGGGLGFAFGGRSSDAKGGRSAVGRCAGESRVRSKRLRPEVKELNDKIGGAIKDLKDKKFPDAFANELGGSASPSVADKLTGGTSAASTRRCCRRSSSTPATSNR